MYDVVISGSDRIGNSLASFIASNPSLMKTFLPLNGNYPIKSRVFHLSIVGSIISSKHTIGNRLVYMREAVNPIVALWGVYFLEILSEDKDENELILSMR